MPAPLVPNSRRSKTRYDEQRAQWIQFADSSGNCIKMMTAVSWTVELALYHSPRSANVRIVARSEPGSADRSQSLRLAKDFIALQRR